MTHRLRHSTALALTLLWTAGCATGAARGVAARPIDAPAWHGTADGVASASADLSRWWQQLDDTTLTGLIDTALRDSPDVHIAQARLRQARAQRAQAAAQLWPTVTGSGSASGRQASSDGTTSRNGSLGASIDASWEPDVFGGTRAGIDAASAELAASAADLQATHVSLAAEVALTYGDLRTWQARLAIARSNEASQAETLTLTSFRAQAGLVSSLDVEQARTNLAQTRAQIPSLEATVTQATYRLATLTGQPAGTLTASLATAAPLPAVPAQIAIGIPADTLRQRPDIRAAEQRVLAETARLTQADTRRYPRFALSGTVGAEVLSGAITGGTSLVSSLAASLAQTLFDHGRIRQQIAIQSAVQEQAVASYEAVVLTALEDVENALVSFEGSRQRLASLEEAATAARDAALLARTQYAAGLTDFQTVLNTERTVLSVQDSVALTAGDRVTALIQLYKAVGGGWSPAPAQTGTRS